MTKVLIAAAAAGAALLLASSVAARPSADDCVLGAYVFPYWGGADAEAQGRVECETAKKSLSVSAVVTRDGAFVASGGHRCSKATRCRITFAPLDDPDGDQRWCVEVRAEVQNTLALGPRTFCEESATP